MDTKAFELLADEQIIDTWPLIYLPPGGGKYDVRCTITNKRIMYTSNIDTKVKMKLAEFIWCSPDNRECMVIPKTRIRLIKTEKTYLEKKVILTLDNGQQHAFSYGPLNIDRVVEAMSSS
jgi:hypothetical protein